MNEKKLSDVLGGRPVVGWTLDNKPMFAVMRAEIAALEARLEVTLNALTVAIVAIAGGEASDDTRKMLEIALVAAQKEGK